MTTTTGAEVAVEVEFYWTVTDSLEDIEGWELWTATPAE